MAINNYRLEVFCIVAELQSISRAAERLSVTQPVVSRLMAELERHYGTALLVRQGRQVVPTDAGVTVYRYARDLLHATQETDRLVRELGAGDGGQVAVAITTAIGSYSFPAVWHCFLQAHPRTQLVLNLVDSQRVVEQVQDGVVDLGLALPAALPHGVVACSLGPVQMVFIAAPGHRLADRAVAAAELAGEPLLWTNGATLAPTLDAYGLTGRCPIIRFGDTETVKRGVELGLGLARLPAVTVERELAAGTMARVRAGPEAALELLLVQRKAPLRSPVVNAFLEYLTSQGDQLCGRPL